MPWFCQHNRRLLRKSRQWLRPLCRRRAVGALGMTAVYLAALLPLPVLSGSSASATCGGKAGCGNGTSCGQCRGEIETRTRSGDSREDCCCPEDLRKSSDCCCYTPGGNLRSGSCCSESESPGPRKSRHPGENAPDKKRSPAFVSCPCGCGTSTLFVAASEPRLTPPAASLPASTDRSQRVAETPAFLPDVHFSPETPPPCLPGVV